MATEAVNSVSVCTLSHHDETSRNLDSRTKTGTMHLHCCAVSEPKRILI